MASVTVGGEHARIATQRRRRAKRRGRWRIFASIGDSMSDRSRGVTRSRRESFTSPNESITVNDAIDGIRRVAFARENSYSSAAQSKHTLKSRWRKLKAIVGASPKSLSSGMYKGCLERGDLQRILDQWLKLCGLNKAPLVDLAKIEAEIEKRSKQAESKEIKAKLDLSGCQLSTAHLQLLCRVLVSIPKISSLNISDNPGISSSGLYTLLQLLFSQIDAARKLKDDHQLPSAILLSDVVWDGTTACASDGFSSSGPEGQLGSGPLLEEMLGKATAELKVINVRSWVQRLWASHGAPEVIDDPLGCTIYQKVVGSGGMTDYRRLRSEESATELAGAVAAGVSLVALQDLIVKALQTNQLLPPPAPPLSTDSSPAGRSPTSSRSPSPAPQTVPVPPSSPPPSLSFVARTVYDRRSEVGALGEANENEEQKQDFEDNPDHDKEEEKKNGEEKKMDEEVEEGEDEDEGQGTETEVCEPKPEPEPEPGWELPLGLRLELPLQPRDPLAGAGDHSGGQAVALGAFPSPLAAFISPPQEIVPASPKLFQASSPRSLSSNLLSVTSYHSAPTALPPLPPPHQELQEEEESFEEGPSISEQNDENIRAVIEEHMKSYRAALLSTASPSTSTKLNRYLAFEAVMSELSQRLGVQAAEEAGGGPVEAAAETPNETPHGGAHQERKGSPVAVVEPPKEWSPADPAESLTWLAETEDEEDVGHSEVSSLTSVSSLSTAGRGARHQDTVTVPDKGNGSKKRRMSSLAASELIGTDDESEGPVFRHLTAAPVATVAPITQQPQAPAVSDAPHPTATNSATFAASNSQLPPYGPPRTRNSLVSQPHLQPVLPSQWDAPATLPLLGSPGVVVLYGTTYPEALHCDDLLDEVVCEDFLDQARGLAAPPAPHEDGSVVHAMQEASFTLELFFDRVLHDDPDPDSADERSRFDVYQSDEKWRVQLEPSVVLHCSDHCDHLDHSSPDLNPDPDGEDEHSRFDFYQRDEKWRVHLSPTPAPTTVEVNNVAVEVQHCADYYGDLVQRAQRTVVRTQALLGDLKDAHEQRSGHFDHKDHQPVAKKAVTKFVGPDYEREDEPTSHIRERDVKAHSCGVGQPGVWRSSVALAPGCLFTDPPEPPPHRTAQHGGPDKPVHDRPSALDLSGQYKTESELVRAYPPPRQVITLLDLSCNAVEHPSRLQIDARFTALRSLVLSANHITGVLSCSVFPRSLQHLDLSANAITLLTDGAAHLPALISLDLSYNHVSNLAMLPPSLVSLKLSHNLVGSVAVLRILALNPRLQQLDIAHNPLPASAHNLEALRRLVPCLRDTSDHLLGQGSPQRPPRRSSAAAPTQPSTEAPWLFNLASRADMDHSANPAPRPGAQRASSSSRGTPVARNQSRERSSPAAQGHARARAPVPVSKPPVPTFAASRRSVLATQQRSYTAAAVAPVSSVRGAGARAGAGPPHARREAVARRPHVPGPAYVVPRRPCEEYTVMFEDEDPLERLASTALSPEFREAVTSSPSSPVLEGEGEGVALKDWLETARKDLSRCRVLLQEIVDLANIQRHVSASTLRAMQQEWEELGFFEQQTFQPLRFPTAVQGCLRAVGTPLDQAGEAGEAQEAEEAEEAEEVAECARDLLNFHALFVQVGTVMQLCTSASANGKFRSMMRCILTQGVGLKVNSRLHFIYEVLE